MIMKRVIYHRLLSILYNNYILILPPINYHIVPFTQQFQLPYIILHILQLC